MISTSRVRSCRSSGRITWLFTYRGNISLTDTKSDRGGTDRSERRRNNPIDKRGEFELEGWGVGKLSVGPSLAKGCSTKTSGEAFINALVRFRQLVMLSTQREKSLGVQINVSLQNYE